ncbi:MAG TPA: NAD(P)-binding protein, partial [Pseudonocardiaceae bacterium]
ETNLGRGRALSERHVAYYARRAAGGAGIVVTETASVHESDWPYERAPLAAECAPGWSAVLAACRPHGALVLAGLGHAGSQGSSAYSQAALWAPSRVADVASRELPMAMEEPELAALLDGYTTAASLAVSCDLDGVEIEAGQYSLLRQFASGLTNRRDDAYGTDRGLLLAEVVTAVRAVLGGERVLGLRLGCDELAPWAGITPERGAELAARLAPLVDYLVPVRGSAMNTAATRPDLHTPPMVNAGLCRAVRAAVAGRTTVVLQGSVVDPSAAAAALADGTADLVEMTRAQIADPDLVALVRAGAAGRVRPCVLCNQRCRVRDPRNPIVSCLGEPRSGHETTDPALPSALDQVSTQGKAPDALLPATPDQVSTQSKGPATAPAGGPGVGSPDRVSTQSRGAAVLVVGGGPAGLEAARVLALHGRAVEVVEREDRTGGSLRLAARLAGRERLARLADWLDGEVRRLGVGVRTGVTVTPEQLVGRTVLLATGSRPGPRPYLRAEGRAARPTDGLTDGHPDGADHDHPNGWADGGGTVVVDARELAAWVHGGRPVDELLGDGAVLVVDPVGDWTGVGVAELLAAAGRDTAIVTQDGVVGTQLALTGDLAEANGRLQRAGVRLLRRSVVQHVADGKAVLRNVFTAEESIVDCGSIVHCGHRLADAAGMEAAGYPTAGDCVAPRTAYEAILEGRRAALALLAGGPA